MNSNAVDPASKDAASKRAAEQTYDKLDVIACERTRTIAEALINQLTNEKDNSQSGCSNAERINKLRDSSKLFEPLRDRKEPVKPAQPENGEPAKKLLRELLEQGNAQLRAEEHSTDGMKNEEEHQNECNKDSGCQIKLTSQQLQTIVLQSSTTSVDLEALQPPQNAKTEVGASLVESSQTTTTSTATTETTTQLDETPQPTQPVKELSKAQAKAPVALAKTPRQQKANKAIARRAGATPNKNILSLISQSEVLVNDAVRKAQGTLKKIKG